MNDYNLISRPVPAIQGTISVPGDKSISHRSIILGAIAEGKTEVTGFLEGEDCLATLSAFRAMGVHIEKPQPEALIIHGVGKHGLKQPESLIDCGNSGTTMRLMAGLLAAQAFDSALSGDASLLKRPMLRIAEPLQQMGAVIATTEGKAPLRITGNQSLKGIDYELPQASAQVKSCLLLAGMYAKGTTRITENEVSRDHTERMLKTLGYKLLQDGNTLIIDAQSTCQAAKIQVPGDFSSAAFFIVAATLIPGSDVSITNVGVNPTRIGLIHILREMGAHIEVNNLRHYGEEPVADIRVLYAPLQGIAIPASLVPLAIDEFPIIFIAAACAKGETRLHGAKELRVKESDRIGAMVAGLQSLGIEATGFDDGVSIMGGMLKAGAVESRGDHRIAMAFAIAGSRAAGPVHISDCAHVATSFPGFVATAKALQLLIEELPHDVK